MSASVFIIGAVWVEPQSSAAGSRMLQLIQYFQEQKYHIHFGTAAQKNPNSLDLSSVGVQVHGLALNDISFDELIQSINPTIVVFDRFMTEEQFGWRVAENAPHAVRILDTEDLHCLRKVREKKWRANEPFEFSDLLSEDITKREIASILRSDISLIISSFELELLQQFFFIDASLLCYVPYLLDLDSSEIPPTTFQERKHFVSLGNFLHAPNLNSVVHLKKNLWSKIREQLPDAQLHIYGAYPTQQVLEFHKPNEGFYVHGFVEDKNAVLENARVLLAPLQFGAGLKGKFIDAAINGCPSVTTSIGIEGYGIAKDWGGLIADSPIEFAKSAVELYTDPIRWKQAQKRGIQLLGQFDLAENSKRLTAKISAVQSNLAAHRNKNFMGSLLHHHSLQSTKYLGKWIEAKNQNKPT